MQKKKNSDLEIQRFFTCISIKSKVQSSFMIHSRSNVECMQLVRDYNSYFIFLIYFSFVESRSRFSIKILSPFPSRFHRVSVLNNLDHLLDLSLLYSL